MKRWLSVVGIGEDGIAGLAPVGRALVETAEVLIGGARHLGMVPQGGAERLVWERPLDRTIEAIAHRRGRNVTVLASGDPLWYGVGVTLARRFMRDEMTIVPQPSAFSLAAARLGWPVADCATITLCGRPLDTLRLHLAPDRRILALSEDGDTPRAAARVLTGLGWGPSLFTVLSHLGGTRERVVEAKAQDWGDRRVPALNTVAITCRGIPGARALPLLAGLPDDAFEHDGQMTKREVRAATIAALAPLPGETLWDVGAGRPSSAAGTAPLTMRSSGTPRALALRAMIAARDMLRSIAIAERPAPARSHSIAIEPQPAPTSHRVSPGSGASAASAAARTSRLVS